MKRGGKNRPLLGRGLAIKANITVEQTLGHLSAKARATELIKMTGGSAKQERNVTLIRPTVAVVGASQAPRSSKSRLETAASSATKKRPQLAMATGMGIDLESVTICISFPTYTQRLPHMHLLNPSTPPFIDLRPSVIRAVLKKAAASSKPNLRTPAHWTRSATKPARSGGPVRCSKKRWARRWMQSASRPFLLTSARNVPRSLK